jgi:CheY-like chemotaxis protein
MSSGPLIHHQDQNRLELNGVALRREEQVEIRIMGHWILGRLDKDVKGWYLITSDKVEIRLRSGLAARFPEVSSFSKLLSKGYPYRPELPEGTARKLVLLVEDDKSHGSMLYQLFTQETPYGVYATSDGQTAWEFLQHVKPNLLVLDYLLPHMNGLMLYDRICGEESLQDIPVLMVSAALPSDEVKKRGIVGLQKPFEIDEFLHAVEDLIA